MARAKPFSIRALNDRREQGLACIDSLDNVLYIGTEQGEILRVTPEPYSRKVIHNAAKPSVQLIKTFKIGDNPYLVYLNDSSLFLLNIAAPGQATRVKVKAPYLVAAKDPRVPSQIPLGASSSSSSGGEERPAAKAVLAVATKKKVSFFGLKNGLFDQIAEVSVSENPVTISWFRDVLVVATSRSYYLIDLDKAQPIRNPTQVAESRTKTALYIPPLPFPYELANAQAIISRVPELVVSEQKASLILILQNRGIASFCNPSFQCLNSTQNINFNEDPISLAYSYPFVLALYPSQIKVASVFGSQATLLKESEGGVPFRSICSMVQRPIPSTMRYNVDQDYPEAEQMDNVVGANCIYAISSSFIVEFRPVALSRHIAELQVEGDYDRALRMVVNLPPLTGNLQAKKALEYDLRSKIAIKLFHTGNHEAALKKFLELRVPVDRVLPLFPEFHPSSFSTPNTATKPLKVYKGLLEYLLEARRFDPNINQSISSSSSSGLLSSSSAVPGAGVPVPVDFKQVQDLATIVDTTILRLMLQSDQGAVSSFVRQPNSCHLQVSLSLLEDESKKMDRVGLLQSKGQHQDALRILDSIVRSPSGSRSAEVVGQCVKYLQCLGGKDSRLLFEYCDLWFDKILNRELFVSVFTAEREARLVETDVINFLSQAKYKEIYRSYVEWRVNKLILQSQQSQSQSSSSSSSSSGKGVREEVDKGSLRKLYTDYAQNVLTTMTEQSMMQRAAGFREFLKNPDFAYDAQLLLEAAGKRPSLWVEEMAILHTRLGNHKAALKLFESFPPASRFSKMEQHCLDLYRPNDPLTRNIFTSLLETLVDSRADEEVISGFLKRQGPKMNLVEVVNTLPASLPLHFINEFIQEVLSQQLETLHQLQIVKSLRHVENLTLRGEQMRARSHMIPIEDDSACSKCLARLGNGVFVRTPTGDVLHYYCYH